MNKTILADNQEIFKAGIARILALEDDFRIIAHCNDSVCLYHALERFREAIIVFASTLKLDLQSFTEQVRAQGSRSIAVIENGEPAQPFISAGVQGVVHRSTTGSALIECARRVGRGELGVHVIGSGIGLPEEDPVGIRVRNRLTPKEMKIVSLIVQGRKNKEISILLTTTEQVIKNYLCSIFDKTGVSGRLELAIFTIQHHSLAEAVAVAGENLLLTS